METYITKEVHDEFSRRIDEENRRQNNRIASLEDSVKQIGALTNSVEKLATSMEGMVKEQEKQGKKLELLEARDGEMWRKVVGYIITAVVGIVIGLIATQIGVS